MARRGPARLPRLRWRLSSGYAAARSTDTPAPFAQFEVELKSDGVLASDVGTAVVLSPDGTRVVFVSRTADGRTHLEHPTTRSSRQRSRYQAPTALAGRLSRRTADGSASGPMASSKRSLSTVALQSSSATRATCSVRVGEKATPSSRRWELRGSCGAFPPRAARLRLRSTSLPNRRGRAGHRSCPVASS